MRETSGIIRVGKKLLVRLQGDLDDVAVTRMEEEVLKEVARADTRGMLIDVGDLMIVDSFIAHVIARLARMVRLLGVHVVLVGIQPAVAITLVDLGAKLDTVVTALNAERGMILLERMERET